jgi:hypothetical protein
MAKRDQWLNKLPFAPIVAALFALIAIGFIAAMPYWLFVKTVAESGLPSIIPAATPPLGDKARIVAMALAGLLTGAVTWLLAKIAERFLFTRKPKVRARGGRIDASEPIIATDERKRKIGSRPPLFAQDELGAPLMSDEAIDHAREELILDAPVAEAADELVLTPPEVDTVDGDEAMELTEVLDMAPEDVIDLAETEPEPVAIPEAVAVAVAPEPFAETPQAAVDDLPLAALMARLENGLAKRPANTPPLGDIGPLRRALGMPAR